MSRLLLSVWADHTRNPNTCQPRTGLTGSTQAEDTKHRHQSGHSYSLQAASSSGAQAGIRVTLLLQIFTAAHIHTPPAVLPAWELEKRLVKGSWGLFIREQTVQRNSNMSHIWLQALFICKPRFHHWLTCLHWLLINELQKFVMHESFIRAGVNKLQVSPVTCEHRGGAVKRDPSAASQSPDSLTDLWRFGNDRRIHNCSANARQQGGQGGVEVPRRITQTTKKHAV